MGALGYEWLLFVSRFRFNNMAQIFDLPGEIILLFFFLNGYIEYTVANSIVQSRVIYEWPEREFFPNILRSSTRNTDIIQGSDVGVNHSSGRGAGFIIPLRAVRCCYNNRTMAGIELVTAHTMSSLAYIRYARKDRKIEYGILKDMIIPLISFVVLIPIIIFVLDEPTWHYILSPILAALCVLGSFIFGLYRYKNKRKNLMQAGVRTFPK